MTKRNLITFLKKCTVSALIVALLANCSRDKETKIITREAEAQQKIVVDQEAMDAEELALAGEQLITPYSFMHAYKVFGEALKKDPNNFRAQLYSGLLQRVMIFKGIGRRARPLVQQFGRNESREGVTTDLQDWDKGFSDILQPSLRDFLLDGKEDLKTAEDVQKFLQIYQDSSIKYYRFLKQNQAQELVIYLNPTLFQDYALNSIVKTCRIVDIDQVVVSPSAQNRLSQSWTPKGKTTFECNTKDAYKKKLNVGDLIPLRMMSIIDALYLTLPTSYSMQGLETVIKTIEGKTNQQAVSLLRTIPGMGTLMANHTLGLFREIGADTTVILQWLLDYQKTLCANGEGQLNREGYLLEEGICLENTPQATRDAERLIGWINGSLRGMIDVKLKTINKQTKSTKFDPLVVVREPVQNIFSFWIDNVNSCGKQSPYSKIFPLGDTADFIDCKYAEKTELIQIYPPKAPKTVAPWNVKN